MGNALVPRFDYRSVDPDFADELRATAEKVRHLTATATEAVIQIGETLLAVRERPGFHGKFMSWVATECGYSHDTAEWFMRVTKFLAGKSDDLRNLSPTALRLLSRKSTPSAVVSAIAKRAEAGQRPTENEIKVLITRTKSKPRVKPARPVTADAAANTELVAALKIVLQHSEQKRVPAVSENEISAIELTAISTFLDTLIRNQSGDDPVRAAVDRAEARARRARLHLV